MRDSFRFVIFFIIALSFNVSTVQTAFSQAGPPVIDNFQIERVAKNGRESLVFTWTVSNVNSVQLLQDGRAISSRIQLGDGSFGWPAYMPGAFSTSGVHGSFTLIAENAKGRLSAVGKYDGRGCFAWLSPPNTHWQRCKRGGQVAANLGVNGVPVAAQCTGEGRVTSVLNFKATVPIDYSDPSQGTTTERLDIVWISRVRTDSYRPLRLSGHGEDRLYRFSGLKGGHDYIVGLPTVWRGQPQRVRFHCPASAGEHRIHPRLLHNISYSDDS